MPFLWLFQQEPSCADAEDDETPPRCRQFADAPGDTLPPDRDGFRVKNGVNVVEK